MHCERACGNFLHLLSHILAVNLRDHESTRHHVPQAISKTTAAGLTIRGSTAHDKDMNESLRMPDETATNPVSQLQACPVIINRDNRFRPGIGNRLSNHWLVYRKAALPADRQRQP